MIGDRIWDREEKMIGDPKWDRVKKNDRGSKMGSSEKKMTRDRVEKKIDRGSKMESKDKK